MWLSPSSVHVSFLVVITLSFAGCGGSGSYGGATPETTFQKFKSALKKRDYKTAFAQTTPESQEVILGGFAKILPMAAASDPKGGQAVADEIRQILDKFGMKRFNFDQVPPGRYSLPFFHDATAGVKDKPACIDAVIAWVLVKDPQSSMGFDHFADMTLSKVQIDGDAATAIVQSNSTGRTPSETMKFKQIDGSWFVDLWAMMQGRPQPAN